MLNVPKRTHFYAFSGEKLGCNGVTPKDGLPIKSGMTNCSKYENCRAGAPDSTADLFTIRKIEF